MQNFKLPTRRSNRIYAGLILLKFYLILCLILLKVKFNNVKVLYITAATFSIELLLMIIISNNKPKILYRLLAAIIGGFFLRLKLIGLYAFFLYAKFPNAYKP